MSSAGAGRCGDAERYRTNQATQKREPRTLGVSASLKSVPKFDEEHEFLLLLRTDLRLLRNTPEDLVEARWLQTHELVKSISDFTVNCIDRLVQPGLIQAGKLIQQIRDVFVSRMLLFDHVRLPLRDVIAQHRAAKLFLGTLF